MLNFPSYSSLLFWLIPLFTGLIGTALCIWDWDSYLKGKRQKLGELVFCFLLFGLILLFGTFNLVKQAWRVNQFRNIDPSKVKGFQINRLPAEGVDRLPKLIVNDPQIVQELFQSLQDCENYSRDHERFENGYTLKLLFSEETGSKEFYFTVYRRNGAGKMRAVVIPHFDESRKDTLREFRCPKFRDLVEDKFDPLFQNQ